MTDPALQLPPTLRFLKWLVIVLMITMIVGVITIVGLLVTRWPVAAPLVLPDAVHLPDHVLPIAVTFHKDWIAVVGSDDQIHIFDRNGAAKHVINIGALEGESPQP